MMHRKRISCLAFSPGGGYLASGGEDHSVAVWDVGTGKKIREFNATDDILALAFNPSGELLALGGMNRKVLVWDITTGMLVTIFQYPRWIQDVVFSDDGSVIASGGGNKKVTVQTITGNVLLIESKAGWVTEVAFSPDGKYVASAGHHDIATIDMICKKSRMGFYTIFPALSVSFSPDGLYLSTGTISGKLNLYMWRERKNIYDADLYKEEINVHAITGIVWFFRFFALQTTDMVVSPFMEIHDKSISSMALSRRGFLALGYTDGKIEIFREG